MLNKKWRHRIIDTKFINERVVTATIVVNHQRITLLLHSGYADQHVEKCAKRSRSTRQIAKNTYRLLEETSMQNWDLAAEPSAQVLADTHSTKETEEVTGWSSGWCYKATHHSTRWTERHLGNKRPTDLHKRNEKKIDYILTKRRYLKYNKDAEANNMIQMGSDHRCVMATFMITTPEKSNHCTTKQENSIQQSMKGGIKPRKTLELRSLSTKKDTKRSLKKQKKNRRHQKKSSCASKKRRCRITSKNVNAEAEAKMRMQKRKQNKSKERSQWRGGRSHRASCRTCRTRHGWENDDYEHDWRDSSWKHGLDGVQARRYEWRTDQRRDRNWTSWWRASCGGRRGRFYRATCQQWHEREGTRWWRGGRDSSSKSDWGDIKGIRGNQKSHRQEKKHTQRRETASERSEQTKKHVSGTKKEWKKTAWHPTNTWRLQRV